MSADHLTTGIIGAGPISRAMATLWVRAGHRVRVGSAYPEAARAHGMPPGVHVGGLRHAAAADVVVIAIRHRMAPAVLATLRDELAGKVVIDTMNPGILRDYLAAGLSRAVTEGSRLARLLPDAEVARAFSHLDPEVLVPRAPAEPGRWAIGFAADAPRAGDVAARLITDAGYVPVRVGTLAESAPLDYGGALWPYMFTPEDMRYTLSAR